MESDFRVGEWLVRPRLGRIECADQTVRVKPKSMAVLQRLAASAGDVVRRNELFDAVWPGSVVTDDVLTQSVVELRKAFGDSARDSRVIETVPRIGFRLVGPVTPAGQRGAQPRPTSPPRSRFFSSAAVGLLVLGVAVLGVVLGRSYGPGARPAVAGEASIAVLPFVDMSPEESQGYFADGLTEELINTLSKLDGLLVTGRTSSFHFKGRNEDLRTIGDVLGVGHILEGSVRKSGDALRVTAQLIDVRTGFHRWSDTYDRPLADIFAVQDEIAEGVATALSITLQVGLLGTIAGGTHDVEAYEELMRGNALYAEFTPGAMALAVSHYERATALDPDFAIAWANIADIHRSARIVLPKDEANAQREYARAAIERALEIAPDAPYVLIVAANMNLDDGNWAEVERLLRRASEIDARLDIKSIGVFTEYLVKAGRASEAIVSVERSRRSEPLSPGVAMFLGHLYAMQGRLGDALAEFERGYGLDGLQPLISVEGLITALATGNTDQIETWLARAIEHQAPGALGVHDAMARRLHDRDAALEYLRVGYRHKTVPDYYVAAWAAYYGEAQLALAALRRSPDPWLYWAPVATDLRRQPEFVQLVSDTGLAAHWREFGWGDFCKPAGGESIECL